jgi:hypothetical protein
LRSADVALTIMSRRSVEVGMAVDRGIDTPGQNGGWILLYPGPKIVVTTWWVENSNGRYPIAQLTRVSRIEQRSPRWMALRAIYRGREVELFSTNDKAEFERVRLAVIRAVEAGRDPRP